MIFPVTWKSSIEDISNLSSQRESTLEKSRELNLVQADLSVSPRGFLIRSNHTIRKQRSAEPIAIRLNDFIISINNRIRYKIQLFCDSVLKIHCISTFMPSDCNWLRRTLFPYNSLEDGLKLATPNAVSAPTSRLFYISVVAGIEGQP